jgi:hypothetical protein
MRDEEEDDEAAHSSGKMGRLTIALASGGIAAGLSFASKQNIRFYALAALLFSVIIGLWGRPKIRSRLLIAVPVTLLSFCLTVVIVLVPVWLSGGWAKLLEYGFMNRLSYLQFAQVSYFEAIKILKSLVRVPNSAELLTTFFMYTLFLWPFLTFGSLLMALTRKHRRKRLTAVVTVFVATAFFGVFPRADLPHLAYAIPELLISLIYSWNLLKPKQETWWVKPIQVGIVLWIGIGMSLILATSIAKIQSPKYGVSRLPHFRKVLIERRVINEIGTSALALSEAAHRGERPFLLSPGAGLFYLVSGAKNPTPFDYPLVTAFGRDGEADVISSFVRGSISSIWVDTEILAIPRLRPMRLLIYLGAYGKPGEKLGIFTPYSFH